jgi:hypothetical protein
MDKLIIDTYKPGDRVMGLCKGDLKVAGLDGKKGTIKKEYLNNVFSVEFDEFFAYGHTCDGSCKDEYGWYCEASEIVKITEGNI